MAMRSIASHPKPVARHCLFVLAAAASAVVQLRASDVYPIPFGGLGGSGDFSRDISLVIDGFTPPEGGAWSENTLWWQGTTQSIQVVFKRPTYVSDFVISADNNDTYLIEYSLDLGEWVELQTIPANVGEISSGMDTMSTIEGSSEYVPEIDFAQRPLADRVRITAIGPDVFNSIGEVQFFTEINPGVDLEIGLAVELVFATQADSVYRVEVSTDFGAGPWELAEIIDPGTGSSANPIPGDGEEHVVLVRLPRPYGTAYRVLRVYLP